MDKEQVDKLLVLDVEKSIFIDGLLHQVFINEKAIDEIVESFKSIEVSDDIKIQQIS